MRAVLTVPPFGPSARADVAAHGKSAVTLNLPVQSAVLTLNSHLLADELKLTAPWKDIGIDPRLVKNATVQFYMGNEKFRIGEDETKILQNPKFYRFAGICRSVNRNQKGDSGAEVELTFQDWTSLFLDMKPFPSDGIPDLTDTLTTAWEKICEHTGFFDLSTRKYTSSVEQLIPRLVFRGVEDQQLGQSVPKRVAKLGKVQITQGQSAWDVWQVCCGMLSLISYVDRDDIIVTTSTEHYSQNGKIPRFVYGRNLYDASETASSTYSAKGIGLTCFNPLTGVVMESFYPPMGDKRLKAKRAPAKVGTSAAPDVECSDYEVFEYNGCMITSQDMLDRRAKLVYDERARQELQGRFSTVEMEVDEYDLLDLHAGDPINVSVDDDLRDALTAIGDPSQQLDYLINVVNYSEGVANLLVKSFAGYASLKSIFHVKQAEIKLDDKSFSVDIQYQNLISIDGQADADNSTIDPALAKAPTSPASLHAPPQDRTLETSTGITSIATLDPSQPLASANAATVPATAAAPMLPGPPPYVSPFSKP